MKNNTKTYAAPTHGRNATTTMGYDRFLDQMPPDLWKLLPHTFAIRVSEGKWVAFDYLVLLSHILAAAIAKGDARILISVPPRHGKSWFVSQYVPAWFLTTWSDQKVILSTYEANFAATWGRKVRNIILENQDLLGIYLSEDSRAVNNWELAKLPDGTGGGGMITAGVGGPITGKGGNLIIVDDPHKNWEETQSETIRRKVQEWYDSTLYTRAEPGASIIILHTRWHEDDLIGYLLREKLDENYIHIRIPAISEEFYVDGVLEEDPLGRVPGEALCPQRYDINRLGKIKSNLSTIMWNALFQQRPSALEGNMFKRQNWRYYTPRIPPRCNFILQSWDTASKDRIDSARTVCHTWGISENSVVLLDRWGSKVLYPQLRQQVDIQFYKFRPNVILIEDKDTGRALIQELQQYTSYPVIPVIPTVDKVIRATAILPMQESGRLLLPDPSDPDKPPWIADFIDDCALFPNGMYKDDIDAMSQALHYVMTMAGLGRVRRGLPRRTTSLLDGYRMLM